MREAGPYLGLGMQLGMTVAFFTIGGYFLDRWLGTTPWFILGGALLGMVAGFIKVVRVSAEMSERSKARRKANQVLNAEEEGGGKMDEERDSL